MGFAEAVAHVQRVHIIESGGKPTPVTSNGRYLYYSLMLPKLTELFRLSQCVPRNEWHWP
jgi:hypothetical protein